jgi:hypothetical protein
LTPFCREFRCLTSLFDAFTADPRDYFGVTASVQVTISMIPFDNLPDQRLVKAHKLYIATALIFQSFKFQSKVNCSAEKEK